MLLACTRRWLGARGLCSSLIALTRAKGFNPGIRKNGALLSARVAAAMQARLRDHDRKRANRGDALRDNDNDDPAAPSSPPRASTSQPHDSPPIHLIHALARPPTAPPRSPVRPAGNLPQEELFNISAARGGCSGACAYS